MDSIQESSQNTATNSYKYIKITDETQFRNNIYILPEPNEQIKEALIDHDFALEYQIKNFTRYINFWNCESPPISCF